MDKLSDPEWAQYHGNAIHHAIHQHGKGGGSEIGGLPFTGLDLIVLALAALALVGIGMAMRRLSR